MSEKKFYECILIIRPDISVRQVSGVLQSIQEVLEKSGGAFHEGEYWGFRSLAYRILKRAKAHYVCLGISATKLDELQRYLKFHRDVLRFVLVHREKGLKFPTPLFHSSLEDMERSSDIVRTEGEAS
jgi:small subunit ribosomal protein S6